MIHLVANPSAGGGGAAPAASALARVITDRGLDCHVHVPADSEHTRRIALQAARSDAVIACGGDGTVHDCLQGLMACADTAVLDGTTFQPTLGILPVGTGNDISRGIDSSARFDEQAFVTALQDRSTRVVDVGRVVVDDGVHYFLGVASCGFDSDVNERANAMPTHVGRARYLLSLVRELPVLRPRWYAIDTDGVDNSMAAMIVAVGNGPAYGSGMLVCPEADVGDGLLDITVVTDTPKRTFVSVLPRVYSGRHVHHPSVVSWRGRRFRIDAPDSLVFADGERIGLLPATIEAVPSALRVVTGPGT